MSNVIKLNEQDLVTTQELNNNKRLMAEAIKMPEPYLSQYAKRKRELEVERVIEQVFMYSMLLAVGYVFVCHIIPWALSGFPVSGL